MKTLQRLCIILFCVLITTQAQAADITVDESTCTLADAITAANSNEETGGCVGSGTYGDDTIILGMDVTLAAALPEIESNITIEGGGYFISGNHDPDVGSVLYIASTGNLTLNNTTVTNGTGHLFSRFIRGGGIYNSGILTLTNSTVSGNYAYHDYGECCNDPISHGGGIYNSGTAMLTNSTISGNSTHCYHYYDGYGSSRGGGIYNSGILTLINSTVSSNYAFASGKGGGIYNDGTVTLYSSLISGNTTDGMMGSGNEVNSTGGIIADSFNLFGHSGETSAEAFNFSPGSNDVTATSDGTKPTALSDILASLADNDGPTKTHALVQDSPAIDLDAICSTSPDTDQRGYPRPEAEGTGCDAGAFEGSIILPHSILPAVYLLLLQ